MHNWADGLNDVIELTAEGMRCVLLPDAGGGLAGCWHGNDAILRPLAPDQWAAPQRSALAGFPLVPFSNRVAGSQFRWTGELVTLRRNTARELHALHGVGWQRPWQVDDVGLADAVLSLDHAGDAFWPWPFCCRQIITLTGTAISIAMQVTNRADIAVPLAAGYHPYFPRDGASITLKARSVWLAGGDALPHASTVPEGDLDLSHPALAAGREIDNCYDGVEWPAIVSWSDRDFVVSVSGCAGLGCAVVYSNADAGALCIEPVAHTNNALNLGEGTAMPVLAPGEQRIFRIVMELVAAAHIS